jgi:hypothetical protein
MNWLRGPNRDLRVEDYVVEVLAQQLGPQHGASPVRSPEEIRAWLDSRLLPSGPKFRLKSKRESTRARNPELTQSEG